MAYQQRLYKLVNLDSNEELVLDGTGTNNEPKNWEDSERTIKKSTKNFSITTELSKKLEFTGSGARFLMNAYNIKGIEARVKMDEYRFNPKTDVSYIYSVGDFNFSKYSSEKNIVNIPFESGTLNALIKAKINDKFELNRTESIDGIAIPDLVTSEFAGINRALDLKSLLETGEDNNSYNDFKLDNTILDRSRYRFYPIPLSVTYESDDNVLSVVPDQFNNYDFSNIGGPLYTEISPETPVLDGISAQSFYFNSERDRTINVSGSLNISIKKIEDTIGENRHLSLRFAKLKGDDNPFIEFPIIPYSEVNTGSKFPEFDFFKTIANFNDAYLYNEVNFNEQFNEEISLLKGESLFLFIFGGGNFFINESTPTELEFNFSNIECSINITELSVRNDINRRTKCVRNNEVGRTLMGLINGDKDTYKSEFFESSDFKNTAITNGKLIRGFDELDITTSLKEFFDNSNSLFNMGYNIEVINGKETLVHEPLRHFFRSQTIIEITEQVNKVKRTPALEFVYSTIKSGYKKPSGDNLYEEVNGLNEFNTINEYTTPITREVKDYSIESPYRADSEGKELTFRQSIVEFPTSDYRTDKTIFNLDLKESGTSVFEERTWQDDYEEAPKNVFSPDTVTGLRLTPFRNMSRHFWFLNSAFTKFTDKYIRYANTRGNSDLITKKAGEVEIAENGNYQINSLENAIFVNEWIEFEYPLTFDLLQQVNGVTEVNGRKIPNTYFKISFINEFNKKESGYLFDLKPSKQGKWKLLKAL